MSHNDGKSINVAFELLFLQQKLATDALKCKRSFNYTCREIASMWNLRPFSRMKHLCALIFKNWDAFRVNVLLFQLRICWLRASVLCHMPTMAQRWNGRPGNLRRRSKLRYLNFWRKFLIDRCNLESSKAVYCFCTTSAVLAWLTKSERSFIRSYL